ncbi:hypothetical protein [Rhodobacter ferrooxidans]|uniref:Methylated-DNA-[protein]-cysteine S-methyltransferase DNA binding domain-containing protein n=1 Tax=Rhodobacter ferrooxidans TaxID=371731 RepID=C8S3X5_9RHOB|nr:hypothetical protein [Rhodobacter sp. SW2]EEW24344.1 conserved hypothetical protein [Rhodobacter sp. SW2]
MIAGLAARLEGLAAAGQTITYGALARELAVPGPGAIARLTTALEALMAEDAAQGRPFRAAVCCGRLGGGLPAPGFFDAARRLGRDPAPDLAGFVAAERAALRNR